MAANRAVLSGADRAAAAGARPGPGSRSADALGRRPSSSRSPTPARTSPPKSSSPCSTSRSRAALADHVAWHLPSLRVETKQELLETLDPQERLQKLSLLLTKEFEILQIQKNIRSRVEKEMGETQREFLLREQMKAIQQELGERDERQGEVDEYRTKALEAKMPEPVAERALKEIDRLEKMPFGVPEGVVIRTYLDTMLALPWSVKSEETLDVGAAEAILDEDHYGLPKVKERILEFLAVRQLAGTLKGPIICFVGPPGVGKTSLGKSIARALGRKFVRISLGGVRDEAEIRGHRRTYIGALPGRILQGLKQAGTRNPVFVLDEIDKMGVGLPGRPVLGPAGSAGPGPEQRVFRPLFGSAVRPVRSHVHHDGQPARPDPARPARPHGSDLVLRLHRRRKAADRRKVPDPQADQGTRPDAKSSCIIPEETIRRIIREHTREAGVRNFERELADHLPQSRPPRRAGPDRTGD